MAELFIKQAKEYANGRPTYPDDLFEFILSKTQCLDLAWDVATGSGQAIPPLAKVFKNVIGTDTSPKQLDFAPQYSNVKYHITPPIPTIDELNQSIASESTVDLVTVAQAIHWLDLPKFYEQVKWALKKPNGVIAVWCYTIPEISGPVDAVFGPFYVESRPYWDEARKLVDDKYRSLYFPFEPVDGLDCTGPIEFKGEKLMKLEDFFIYIRSWSAYNTAKENGVDLLTNEMMHKFEEAWKSEGGIEKVVRFPIHLRIGKVGSN